MSDGPDTMPNVIRGGRQPRNPFRVESLPAIARLCRAAYHRYRNRWAKRLGKRPVRLVFDVAYHGLRLGGRGVVGLALPAGEKRLTFDARQVQFRAIYDAGPDGYEPDVTAICETLLAGRDDAFFDVGANWGYFSLHAATIPTYRGPIHAFEPIAETFADLTGLVGEAGLGDRITCHRLALSDRDGVARMAYDPAQSGLARLGVDAAIMRDVTLTRIDDLGLPAPDLIKLDVENHELAALRGAEGLLGGAAPPYLVFENWIDKHDRAATLAPLNFLERLGYGLFVPEWDRDGAGARILALSRFAPDDRFRFADQINVFACRRDRAAEAAARFSTGGSAADLG